MDGVILIHGKMVLDYRSVNLISSILTKLLPSESPLAM